MIEEIYKIYVFYMFLVFTNIALHIKAIETVRINNVNLQMHK